MRSRSTLNNEVEEEVNKVTKKVANKVDEEVHIIIFIISIAEGREEVVQNLERKPFQVCSHATLAPQLHLLLHWCLVQWCATIRNVLIEWGLQVQCLQNFFDYSASCVPVDCKLAFAIKTFPWSKEWGGAQIIHSKYVCD